MRVIIDSMAISAFCAFFAYVVQAALPTRGAQPTQFVAYFVALRAVSLAFSVAAVDRDRVELFLQPALELAGALSGDLAAEVCAAWVLKLSPPRLRPSGWVHHLTVVAFVASACRLVLGFCNSPADTDDLGCLAARRTRAELVNAFVLTEASSVFLHGRKFLPGGSCARATADACFYVSFFVARVVAMPLLAWRAIELEPQMAIYVVPLVGLQLWWGWLGAKKLARARGTGRRRPVRHE